MAGIGRIRELVIHHTAGSRSLTVKQLRQMHVEERGWSDIGYHYFVDGGGALHYCRPDHLRGAHAPPNEGRLGIALAGDNTRAGDEWSEDQWRMLLEFVRAFRVIHPGVTILGHRDTGRATLCPGLDVRDELARRGVPPGRL